MNSPNRSIPLVPENTLDPAAGLNDAIQVIDALLQTSPISMALTAPPGTSSDGDLYVVASPATGAWAGHENDLARYVDDGNFWIFYGAGTQVNLVLNQDDGGLYKFDQSSSPGSWVLAAGLGDAPADGNLYARRDALWEAFSPGLSVTNEDSPPTTDPEIVELIIAEGLELEVMTGGVARISARRDVVIQVACSDQTTNLSAGAAKATFRAPCAFVLEEVRASINTASSSGDVVVDVNEGGSTVLSTKLSIDEGEKTSVTGSPAYVISDADIADDSEITIDIDSAGAGAKGLVVTLLGRRA